MNINQKNIHVLICARSGSKGIKNKNIKKFGKLSFLENTILQAKKLGQIKSVFVSTDSKKYKTIAENVGATVPFLRPKYLSGDKISEWKVWKHFVKKMNLKKDDLIIVLPTTSPFRKIKDILNGIKLYNKNKFDVVIAVNESLRNPYYNILEKKKRSFYLVKKQKKFFYRRQDAPKTFDVTTFFYILNCKFICKKNSLYDGKIGAVIVPRERSIDLDTKFDFKISKLLNK
jgi:CMP-N-acetylneuraminic acid synthetase